MSDFDSDDLENTDGDWVGVDCVGEDDTYDLHKSPYAEDIRKQAMECMEVFFADKYYWAGGEIPRNKLFINENILTVMQTSMKDSIEVAYAILGKNMPERWNCDQKDWDVQLVFGVFSQCANRFIPKCCAGGILLVYIAVCQGVDYISLLKEYNTSLYGTYVNANS